MLDRLGFQIQVRTDYKNKGYLFMILINFIHTYHISMYIKREPGQRSSESLKVIWRRVG